MKSIFTTIVLTALLFSNSAKSQAANVQDSLALVQLYDSTNGSAWHTSHWLNGPVKKWNGVTLDTDGKVSELDLYQYNLSGQIPASIGNLDELTVLNLSFNSLTGIIPPAIGNLTKLTDLELSINQLTGHIPLTIGNLQNLQILNLGDNKLTGNIPDMMGNLLQLTRLYLFRNRLHGRIPASLGNLFNLELLYCDENKLSGSIPSEIGNLTKLSYLDLQGNDLSGNIPATIGNLVNLNYLYLLDNKLSGKIPSSFENLRNLVLLYLQNNQLEGNIPGNFSNLRHLIDLDISGNNLSGAIPTSINRKNNPEIIVITMTRNNFTFRGLVELVTRFPNTVYKNQGQIPLHYTGNTFSVTGGGFRGTNTYTWFSSNGDLVATKINDSTFQPDVPGSYFVRITNSIATDLTLESDTVATNNLSGILKQPNAKQTKAFSVYPNPARDNIIVHLGEINSEVITLQIINMEGIIVFTKNIEKEKAGQDISLNIASFASGNYVLALKTKNEIITQNFIKE